MAFRFNGAGTTAMKNHSAAEVAVAKAHAKSMIELASI